MKTRRDFALAAAGALGVAASGLHAQAPDAGDVLKSELLMDIELDVGAPQNLGARMIVPVTGGTFSGPKLKGRALGNGGDWISVRPDGASLAHNAPVRDRISEVRMAQSRGRSGRRPSGAQEGRLPRVPYSLRPGGRV